jgi:hypothetical protein
MRAIKLALCFEITINNGAPVLAGVDNISVLSATVTFVSSRNELGLNIGGLVSDSRHDSEHLDWLEQELKRGDSVSIRIVESPAPSLPISQVRQDSKVSEQQERAYYEELKKRYESS